MPQNKSVSERNMSRNKRLRPLPSINIPKSRRSDPEAVRARKLARLAKQLGPVDTSLSRTRQETRLGVADRRPPQPRAAKVYHVSDPRPEIAILPILHRFKNKTIRIVASSGTTAEHVRHLIDEGYANGMLVNVPTVSKVVTRTVHHWAKEWLPTRKGDGSEIEPKVGDHTYKVGDKPNRGFRETHYFDWVVQYGVAPIRPGNPVPFLHPGDVLKVYVVKDVVRPPAEREQAFARGVNHCLITPIITDLTEKREAVCTTMAGHHVAVAFGAYRRMCPAISSLPRMKYECVVST